MPHEALYGLATHRARSNFDISSRKAGDAPELLRALARIKRAAATANRDLVVIPDDVTSAIVTAAGEVENGQHADAFLVDLLEGSGGTSLNMNMNEVLANRALQILGLPPGSYDRVHPNDHVNAGQSTNDVIPAAIKLAISEKASALVAALERLASALIERSDTFADVLRVGRTCMQAGQPMFLGQAFGGYAAAVARQARSIAELRQSLLVLPLGGTAIGTGLGAVPGFKTVFYAHLSEILGETVQPGADVFDAMQNADAFSQFSAALRVCSELIGKIASDLVILSSDESAGLGELRLPAVQPGSSIMPGKVNPVLPMMVQQVAYAVIGNDTTVSLACLSGQLEINHFEPVIASRIFDSMELMTNAYQIFSQDCIAGIEANRERCLENLLHSPAIATVFVSALGYDQVSKLVKTSAAQKRSFIDLSIERGFLDAEGVLDIVRRSASGDGSSPFETT